MTFIEFFDKIVSENICACICCVPEKMILIGSKSKTLYRHKQRYQKMFEDRGYSVEIECKSINRNNLESIVDCLTDVVQNEERCAFGLTGGEELFLTAAGIVYERFKDKNIQLHRYNIRNNTVYDCDGDGNVFEVGNRTCLSVKENIGIYGGEVTETAVFFDDDDFARDVISVWNICRANPTMWNKIDKGGKFGKTVFKKLSEKGLLINGDYKNASVKRLLNNAGTALEAVVYLAAKSVSDENGEPIYNDVQCGVCIDWDGEKFGTKNEIDVLMMHGMVPVFVSCKNGSFGTDELYKLNAVAEKFGGAYAKKVLAVTDISKMGDSALSIKQRATDMDIRIVEGMGRMTFEEIKKQVIKFWKD